MKNARPLAGIAVALIAALGVTGCAGDTDTAATDETNDSEATSVVVEDNHGSVEIALPPQRIIALDNTTFRTLDEWGVELVAFPSGVAGTAFPRWVDDAEVLDIGNHREPDLEQIVAADPDLVIGGLRFGGYYDEITSIVPEAAVIETNPRDGEDHASELKRQTEILGTIFGREDDAAAINERFDTAIADAQAAYNGEDTVLAIIVSGGEIGYVAPVTGRSLGVVFPTLDLVSAIEQDAEDTSHGDDISVEAIAASNPDWIIVLDRDGGIGDDNYIAAAELVESSEALQNVTAIQEGQIVYGEPDFYLDEGIFAYTALYENLASAFTAAQ